MGHLLARSEKEKASRKRKICNAAKALFHQKGYRVTMREIADKTKLSQPALYLYFKNKDELYIETILEGFGSLEAKTCEAIASAKGIEGRLKALFYAFVEHSLQNRGYFRNTQHYFAEDFDQSISSELVERVTGEMSRITEPWVELVQEGIEEGLFKKELNATAFIVLLWRTTTGLLDLAVGEESADAKTGRYGALFEAAITTLLDGAKPRPGLNHK